MRSGQIELRRTPGPKGGLCCAALALAIAFSSPAKVWAQEDDTLSLGDLLEAGQQIWEEHAPPELQEQYRMPTVEEVETFLAAIEADMAEGAVSSLAAYATEAKVALGILQQLEGGEALADWLSPRLDFLIAADRMQDADAAPASPTPPDQSRPPPPAPPSPQPAIPAQYTQAYWNETVAARPRPKQADRYLPVFKKAFEAKGVPTELAWLSEVESSLNLQARSPAGAFGPFQFMPATAERFGLRIGFPDERAHPRKSAEAAASYLAILYRQFNSWPLALAAYNAGEGRVARALKAAGATDFDGVATHLPPETRMYVPKVLATIAAREAIDPTTLPGF